MKVEHYYKPDSKTLREETQVLTRWIDPIIEKLQQENKQLKERIEKAIEKVKDISFKFTSDKFWYCVVLSTTTDGKELLEILEGKDDRE